MARAVKSTAEKKPSETVDRELFELIGLIRPVVVAVKHGGPTPASLRRAFEEGTLGPRHGIVLLTVTLQGQLSVSELAERLALSLSTTSLMVGELSRAGLLERSEDEHDRRRTLVRLNETYRDELTRWLSERVEPFRRTLERLSPRDRSAFIAGWRILAEETGAAARAAEEVQ